MKKKRYLQYNKFWIYFYNSIDEIKNIKDIKKIDSFNNDIEIYQMQYKIDFNINNERIKQEIDKGNYFNAKQMLDDVYEYKKNRSKINIIVFKKYKAVIIVDNDIEGIEDFFEQYKFKTVNLLQKDIINDIFEFNLSENLINLTILSYENNNVIDMIEHRGNTIQNSNIYKDIIEDNNSKVVKYTFQPQKTLYSITFKGINKIEINKSNDFTELLGFLCKFFEIILLKNY